MSLLSPSAGPQVDLQSVHLSYTKSWINCDIIEVVVFLAKLLCRRGWSVTRTCRYLRKVLALNTWPYSAQKQTLPTPRYCQYLTLAHSHIIRAVAAIDSKKKPLTWGCAILMSLNENKTAVHSRRCQVDLAVRISKVTGNTKEMVVFASVLNLALKTWLCFYIRTRDTIHVRRDMSNVLVRGTQS